VPARTCRVRGADSEEVDALMQLYAALEECCQQRLNAGRAAWTGHRVAACAGTESAVTTAPESHLRGGKG
jgi:hypothetical protein